MATGILQDTDEQYGQMKQQIKLRFIPVDQYRRLKGSNNNSFLTISLRQYLQIETYIHTVNYNWNNKKVKPRILQGVVLSGGID